MAAVPEFEATESRYRNGLVGILSRVASNTLEVNHAVEDLRAMIEETVRREIGVFRKEMNVKFESLRGEIRALRKEMEAGFRAIERELTVLRWMMGAMITLLIVVFVLVVHIAYR